MVGCTQAAESWLTAGDMHTTPLTTNLWITFLWQLSVEQAVSWPLWYLRSILSTHTQSQEQQFLCNPSAEKAEAGGFLGLTDKVV